MSAPFSNSDALRDGWGFDTAEDEVRAERLEGDAAAAICECGHQLSEHANGLGGPNTICVAKLANEEDGFSGVCPCVRELVLREAA
jgi:hypothetical protein